MTLIELLIVIVVIGILMVVAVSAVRQARASANESSAVTSLKLILQAQTSFSAACGAGGFAPLLATLGEQPPAGGTGFLDGSLASDPAVRSGYTMQLQTPGDAIIVGKDCHGLLTFSRFYASGQPLAFGSSGNTAYAVTETGAIWGQNAATPPTEPFGPPATVVSK